MRNIWQSLPKPIFCLAPMFGATDSAFRQILSEIGKPDLMFTEFVNVQQIFSPETKSMTQLLSYFPVEQPLIAQIWGLDPELFEAAADLMVDAGFRGIDLNFGCPEKTVVKKGAGAALIDNPGLAGKIIKATLKGAHGRLPVSVKTRLGVNQLETVNWLKFLLSFNLDAITIHCRTARQMSRGPAHWEEISQAVQLRNQLKVKTLIIGNGDLFTRKLALAKIKSTSVDGVMIGRGVFHNPWIFNSVPERHYSKAEKIAVWERHLAIYQATWGKTKPIHPLKRFLKVYLKGFKGALTMRTNLMNSL